MADVHYYRCDQCGGVWTVPKTAAELRRYVTRDLRNDATRTAGGEVK
jgi:hypothetical protein